MTGVTAITSHHAAGCPGYSHCSSKVPKKTVQSLKASCHVGPELAGYLPLHGLGQSKSQGWTQLKEQRNIPNRKGSGVIWQGAWIQAKEKIRLFLKPTTTGGVIFCKSVKR